LSIVFNFIVIFSLTFIFYYHPGLLWLITIIKMFNFKVASLPSLHATSEIVSLSE